jgi:uncharacterized protein (TIGR02996 family)
MVGPSPELAALLSAVADDPDEDAPRLVLADWLEEHGDPARAEFIRLQCELAQLPAFDPRWQALGRRTHELLVEHLAAWTGGAPSSWQLGFERGLLTMSPSSLALMRRRGAEWWDTHGAWVTHLTLCGECRDAALQRLAPRFTRLARLSFQGAWEGGRSVTDEGVKALAGLTQLRRLDLADSTVTDAGLQTLATLTRLQSLNLSRTGVTDEGLAVVVHLQRLRELWLTATAVTDAGLGALAGLRQLGTLALGFCVGITGTGLKYLAGLSRLQTLILLGCPILDAGLKELATLKRLRCLNLGRPDVTDDGLRQLAVLRQLQTLLLFRAGERYTQAGVAALQEALPQCHIRPYV